MVGGETLLLKVVLLPTHTHTRTLTHTFWSTRAHTQRERRGGTESSIKEKDFTLVSSSNGDGEPSMNP